MMQFQEKNSIPHKRSLLQTFKICLLRGHFLDFYPSVRQQDGIVEPSEEYQWLHVTSLWGNVVWMFRHSLSFIIVTRGPKQIVSFYITIWFRITTINTRVIPNLTDHVSCKTIKDEPFIYGIFIDFSGLPLEYMITYLNNSHF